MENSYILSAEEALKYFEVSEDTGLSDPQVNTSREKYGNNGMGPESVLLHAKMVTDRQQLYRKILQRPCGNLYSSSSRTNSLSYC